MAYRSDQRLNDWVEMLNTIYGGTQNYSKSPYEIHAHLTEVCGIFAKHQFKRGDLDLARTFIPKIFSWAVALATKITPAIDMEQLILRKFPNACPYCGNRPCTCWKGDKPTLAPDAVKRLYHKNAPSVARSLNDFQLMFREVYGSSWDSRGGSSPVAWVYLRLVEELAEVAEAVRFHHLYPDNLQNEIADFFAWWFALLSVSGESPEDVPLAEDWMWTAYPGMCPNCQMLPCYCRPGPVRELMSRPTPGQDHRFDALTGTNNQGAFLKDVQDISTGKLMVKAPITCARVDVDDFKAVNTTYGHPAGDAALRHIASMLQQKVRERDRVYRAGGDEFAVLFFDFTEGEAAGALKRAVAALRELPVRWVSPEGKVVEFLTSVSIGVVEFSDANSIEAALKRADEAAYESKTRGKSCVTMGSDLPPA